MDAEQFKLILSRKSFSHVLSKVIMSAISNSYIKDNNSKPQKNVYHLKAETGNLKMYFTDNALIFF